MSWILKSIISKLQENGWYVATGVAITHAIGTGVYLYDRERDKQEAERLKMEELLKKKTLRESIIPQITEEDLKRLTKDYRLVSTPSIDLAAELILRERFDHIKRFEFAQEKQIDKLRIKECVPDKKDI